MEKNGSMDARTYVATHTLKNGVEITIRAIRSEDKRKLLEAFKQLDRSSIYTRFFGHKKSLSEAELERATNLDFHATVALVATMGHGEDEAIVGGGRYSTGGSGSSQRSAEVAFTVEEDYQGWRHRWHDVLRNRRVVLWPHRPLRGVGGDCGLGANRRLGGEQGGRRVGQLVFRP
jgi:hypothetical protein